MWRGGLRRRLSSGRALARTRWAASTIMERNRLKLFEAVQAFLDEAKRS
jgi:hypothetical protein